MKNKSAKPKKKNPNQLRKALARGDCKLAQELIEDLSLDQISEVLFEQTLEDAIQFLTATLEGRLTHLNSPQFMLCGKPPVVSLGEVADSCGPIYGPIATFSFGERPRGWGVAASENRILSWTDQGFGLVGDQVINISDRYITALPLDKFEKSLIVGSLDNVNLLELPAGKQVTLWSGKPLNIYEFDPILFREIFNEALKANSEIFWTYNFRLNAVAREALIYYLNHEDSDKHADILLAKSLIHKTSGTRKQIKQAIKLDSSLKIWADWIALWHDFPKSMKRVFELKSTDPLGPALLTACQIFSDLLDGKTASLDPLEKFVEKQHDPSSPYLSFILKSITSECIGKKLAMNQGGDSAPYEQALRLGYRGENTIAWLMDAIKSGNNNFVRLCMKLGFKPVGRFLQIYLNLLTTASNAGNIEAVQIFLQHGADPEEPSHYGGLDTLALGEQQGECGNSWKPEIIKILQTARNLKK